MLLKMEFIMEQEFSLLSSKMRHSLGDLQLEKSKRDSMFDLFYIPYRFFRAKRQINQGEIEAKTVNEVN